MTQKEIFSEITFLNRLTAINVPEDIAPLLEVIAQGFELGHLDEKQRLWDALYGLAQLGLQIMDRTADGQEEGEDFREHTSLTSDQQSDAASLTPSQQQAFEKMVAFWQGKETYFRLTGFAGTGKSYLIAHLVEYLCQLEIKICLCSPTNKSVKNLKQFLSQRDLNLEPITLARLLKLHPEVNLATGKEEFVQSETSLEITDYDLIIVDEYSMLSRENFQLLDSEISGSSVQVIFVGDRAQLPPVNEEISIVVTHPPIRQEAVLTEIVRYEGEIARVAEQIRSNQQWQTRLYPFETTADGTIVRLPEKQWLDKAIELFQAEEFLENSDYVRLLAWRNATVDKYNKAIRKAVYGRDVPPYIIGDRLIAKKPIFRANPSRRRWDIVADNSEEMLVIGEPQLTVSESLGWESFKIPVRLESGRPLTLDLLTEKAEKVRKKELKKMAAAAKQARADGELQKAKQLWKLFYELEKLFDNATYAYCLTCHKAQGSSIDHVFLYAREMVRCAEKQQILYTALTRARQDCFVCC